MAIIIYGPQGCGKNTCAKMLAQHFGADTVVDDYFSGNSAKLPENSIALTCEDIPEALQFFDVMREIDAKHKEVNRISYTDFLDEPVDCRP